MPVVIPALIAAGYAAATGAVVFGLSTTLSAILIGVATFAVNTLTSALSPQPKNHAANASTSRTVMIKEAIQNRQIIYGEMWCSGQVVYFGVSENNNYFHYVIVLSCHEIDAIDTVWFNSDPIYNTDLDASGNVVSGTYSGFARIKKHLGTDAQTVDPDLLAEIPADITSTFTLSGCAYLYVRLTKNPTVYSSGEPNVSAWLRGKKVYDPRTSTTYWNPNPALCLRDFIINTRYGCKRPSTEINDTNVIAAANSCEEMVSTLSVTHAVSAVNTTLDVITLTGTTLNFQTGDRVTVASDGSVPSGLAALTNYYVIVICPDTTLKIQLATSYLNALSRTAIDITSAGSGNITVIKNAEPRYTTNGLFKTSSNPQQIIDDLKLSMAGDCLPIGGAWQMKAGVYVAPTIYFSEGDMVGPMSVQTKQPGAQRFNRVQGVYYSPVNKGQPTDYPLVADSTFLTEDGGNKVTAQLNLPCTSRAQMAQRIARIQLNRHRRQRTVQWTSKLRGMQVQCGDTLYFSNARRSYVNKVFEVGTFSIVFRNDNNKHPIITCDMIMNETDSAIYSFDETTQEILPQPVQAAAIANPDYVTPPGAPSVSTTTYSTTSGSGVKKKAIESWAASVDKFVYQYQFEYKLTTDSTYIILPRTADVSVTLPDIAPGDYNVRVKAINIFQKESTYSSATQTISTLVGPADMSGMSIVSLNDDVTMTWDQAPDLDVKNAGYVTIRHTPDTSTPLWSNARVLGKFPGITTQVHLPLLAGVYMGKFVDSASNESTNSDNVTLNNAQIFNLNTVQTLTEQTGFTGAKTNMSVSSSVLRLTTTGGVQATTGNYAFSTYIDATKVVNAWVTSHLLMLSYDSTNTFDSRAGNFDDASGLFDGSNISGMVAKLQIATTNDDPGGSPTWSAWIDFAAGYFTGRGFKFQLVVTSANSSYQIDVQELTATVFVPDVHDTVTGSTSSGALATMSYNKTYTTVPNLMGLILDAVAGDELKITNADITATNFKIGVLNSGSYVVRSVVVFVKGY